METSIIQKLKIKAGKFIEPQLLKTGKVLDVRAWDCGTMVEIDLHLPFADMRLWTEAPYIKVRVDNFCFRDYTPFSWDAETSTCSLLINVAHNGAGSEWAKQLKATDDFQYLKIDGSHQSPHPTGQVVALGDASSLAHLLALQQLTLPLSRFDGAMVLGSPQTGKLFKDYFHSPMSVLADIDHLRDWLMAQDYSPGQTWFYLVGNHHLVTGLRGLLKSRGHTNIRVKGFWS